MEPIQSVASEVLRFGVFDLDIAASELRRNGSVVRLAPQPFQVLTLLAQNSGELVDRDRIRREVWGETAVDFDRSLNVCITQIRSALNDDSDSPRFIQTLPRRGYRFLAAVERVGEPVQLPGGVVRGRRWLPLAAVCGLIVAAFTVVMNRSANPPPEQTIRIAVLPFDTPGIPQGEDNPQIDGLFDELLTRLAGVQPDRLRVIGRRSVSRFRNERKPLGEIGQRLDVSHLVEATVRTEGTGLRVAARLVQAASETVLWSESFVQDASPGEFEEQFVARVSAAVLMKLFPGAAAPAERESGCRGDWEAYRTGRLLANRGSIANLEKSISFFEKADCAVSHAALADTFTRLARADRRRRDLWERSRTTARLALASGADLPGAHVALGNVALWRDWDWNTAEREFQSALRRNPSDPDAHHDLAWLLVALGRRSEALASLQRALALDPMSSRTSMDAGWLLLQAGRFHDAAIQARRTLELEPAMHEAHACLSRALLYAGDIRGALEAIHSVVSPDERKAVEALDPAEAIRVLYRRSLLANPAMDSYNRAWRQAWIGSREEALSSIEQAFQTRSSMMPMVAVDPAFAALRNEARFQRIVHDMALVSTRN